MQIKNLLKRYGWAVGLTFSLSYVIFEGLVQNGFLTFDSVRQSAPSQDAKPVSSLSKEGGRSTDLAPTAPISGIHSAATDVAPQKPTEAMQKLESELSRILSERGFTSGEIEVAYQKIIETMTSSDRRPDSLNKAIDSASKALELTEARKKLLRDSLFESFAETGGSFSYQDWSACVSNRIVKFNTTSCAREIAEGLVQDVGAKLADDRITPQVLKSLEPLADKAMSKATETCGIEYIDAMKLLSLHMTHCK